MSEEFIQQATYWWVFVCHECRTTLEEKYILVETKKDVYCNCAEIREGYYNPTNCDMCCSSDVAGCPRHMNRMRILRTKEG